MRKIIFIFFLPFILTGCLGGGSSAPADMTGYDGGVYVSVDKGDNWLQMVAIPTNLGVPQTIGNLMINAAEMDPSDKKAIYVGGLVNGLYYTYNQAQEWHHADSLQAGVIYDIEVDPNNSCTIYVLGNNQVFKTTDCSRSWKKMYQDNNIGILFNSIVVDHYDSSIVYLTTSRGDVLKSYDGGVSWKNLYRINRSAKDLIMDPNDSRVLILANDWGNLYRSKDGGQTWEDLWKSLEDIGIAGYRKMVMPENNKNLIFYATGYSILKSTDLGDTWEKLNLVTLDIEAYINDLAVNNNNPDEIYYITEYLFFRSLDGGVTWSTVQLPTTAGIRKLLHDEGNDAIYIGTYVVAPPEV